MKINKVEVFSRALDLILTKNSTGVCWAVEVALRQFDSNLILNKLVNKRDALIDEFRQFIMSNEEYLRTCEKFAVDEGLDIESYWWTDRSRVKNSPRVKAMKAFITHLQKQQ